MNIININDVIYKKCNTKLNSNVFILKNYSPKILKFDTKKLSHPYITVFNNEHHINYFNKDYLEVELNNLIKTYIKNEIGILIINDLYCNINNKTTIYDSITIDELDLVNHHLFFYKN
jgi:hypothetical protein